ncbi:hypothetical protein [Neptunicoccus sediminis]|uniref:hypothetical protein n=1 Tax=Neptunicoccus sediminis TaxID=1892596 RepID=UPI0012FF75A3|nr:hypothetical protein [Neptunicoccus sediminis]
MTLENLILLIVEDEFLIALDLQEIFLDAGITDIKIAASTNEALGILSRDSVTVAILDINLGSESSLEIALKLDQMKIPFLYHSGEAGYLDKEWPSAPVISKPALPGALISAVSELNKSIN